MFFIGFITFYATILAGMIWFVPMTTLSFENLNLFTISLVVIYILTKATKGI